MRNVRSALPVGTRAFHDTPLLTHAQTKHETRNTKHETKRNETKRNETVSVCASFYFNSCVLFPSLQCLSRACLGKTRSFFMSNLEKAAEKPPPPPLLPVRCLPPLYGGWSQRSTKWNSRMFSSSGCASIPGGGIRISLRYSLTKRLQAKLREKTRVLSFFECFPYVCPEPVLAK
jgi:hypothetical protein